jgi:shikimate kinase
VLLTGVYGSGKSSVAEQIAYLVRRDVMTFLGWP